MEQGLYDDGYILTYKEGDKSLQRDKLVYKEDIEDEMHTIIEGDTLTRIAYRYYKDPLKWYIIADINEIENPFYLEIGEEIIIPNLNKYTE